MNENDLHIDVVLKGSAKAILCIAINPHVSDTYATSAEDGTVKIWHDGRVIHGFLPSCFTDPVAALLWRSQRTLLAASGGDLYLLIHDPSSLVTSKVSQKWSAAEEEVNALSHLGGPRYALGDDAGHITLFNIDTGQGKRLPGHSEISTALGTVTVSGDEILVSGSLDCHLHWTHIKQGRLVHDVHVAQERRSDPDALQWVNPPYVNVVHCIRNRIVLAGLGDGALLCAELKGTGKKREWRVRSVQCHASGVGAMASLGPSADFLLTGSNDKTCRLWRLTSLLGSEEAYVPGSCECQLDMSAKVNAIAALSDSRAIIGDVLGNLTIISIDKR